MRRKDREISDFNEIIEIIKQCDVCRIALNDEDFKFNTDMMEVATVLKMAVTDMVGKRRNNIH